MNADRWQTIEKILHDARELNGNDRVFQSRFSETFGDWQRQGQDLFDKCDTSHDSGESAFMIYATHTPHCF